MPGSALTCQAVLDVDVREFHIDWYLSAAELGGHEYFMLKEIAGSRIRRCRRVSEADPARLMHDR